MSVANPKSAKFPSLLMPEVVVAASNSRGAPSRDQQMVSMKDPKYARLLSKLLKTKG
jgi:hypothetical protein